LRLLFLRGDFEVVSIGLWVKLNRITAEIIETFHQEADTLQIDRLTIDRFWAVSASENHGTPVR